MDWDTSGKPKESGWYHNIVIDEGKERRSIREYDAKKDQWGIWRCCASRPDYFYSEKVEMPNFNKKCC